jgi:hypothetical protein
LAIFAVRINHAFNFNDSSLSTTSGAEIKSLTLNHFSFSIIIIVLINAPLLSVDVLFSFYANTYFSIVKVILREFDLSKRSVIIYPSIKKKEKKKKKEKIKLYCDSRTNVKIM